MVWVYDRTGESMLVAMLMHASYTASTLILIPLALAGVAFLACYLRSGSRAVGRRWSGRRGQWRASLTTATAPEAGGLRKG